MPIFDQERLPVAPGAMSAATIRAFGDSMFEPVVRAGMFEAIRFALAWKQVRDLRTAGLGNDIVVGHNEVGGGNIPALMQAVEAALDGLRVSSNMAWLVTAQELGRILGAWAAAWSNGAEPAANVCPTSDTRFLRHLRAYILANTLSMWIPRVRLDGFHEGKAKLHLLRYDQVPLTTPGVVVTDNMPGVQRFLKLFAAGAHFVVVHSAADTGNQVVPSFYDSVNGNLTTRAARMHSHYTSAFVSNTNSAMYYPHNVTAETAPATNCPFILALLVGRTAWSIGINRYNTFFQLEGWPATGVTGAGGRHGKDFATHNATKWNISTYGASIFSEKRGTTIFLAPPTWQPAPAGGTVMAPYHGAHARQGWLDRNLVR